MPEMNEVTARAVLGDYLNGDTLTHPYTEPAADFFELSFPFTNDQLAAIDWWLANIAAPQCAAALSQFYHLGPSR